MVERVELSCPLCGLLPGLFLLGAVGFDAPCSLTYGEAAERVSLGADQRGSCAGVLGVAVRVGRARAELGAAGLLGPELADQQRPALTLVPLPGLLLLGLCCLAGAVGVADAGVTVGSSCRRPSRPRG